MFCTVFIRNPRVSTIEEDLLEVLCKAEAFPEILEKCMRRRLQL